MPHQHSNGDFEKWRKIVEVLMLFKVDFEKAYDLVDWGIWMR